MGVIVAGMCAYRNTLTLMSDLVLVRQSPTLAGADGYERALYCSECASTINERGKAEVIGQEHVNRDGMARRVSAGRTASTLPVRVTRLNASTRVAPGGDYLSRSSAPHGSD